MVHLAGGYNPEKRRKDVLSKLPEGADGLDKLKASLKSNYNHNYNTRSHNRSNQNGPTTPKNVNAPSGSKGAQWTCIENEMEKMSETEKQIKNYDGPHFKVEFRRLREICIQHQLKLDAIDILGLDDLRFERKRALQRVEKALSNLLSKTHESGNVCPDCEIQNLNT